MPLDLDQAAEKLGVSSVTVQRWARQGRLGLVRPTGEYLFEEEELDDWAKNQGLRIRKKMVLEHEESNFSSKPLSTALAQGAILHNVPGGTPGEVLSTLVELAPVPEDKNRTSLLEQLIARESMASTALSDGIALPHPRMPTQEFTNVPMLVIALLEQPVDWLSFDGEPVHTAILILSPSSSQHLQVLSRLALLLRRPEFISKLKNCASAEEIYALVSSLEV